MSILHCDGCDADLDVSRSEPGSEVSCGGCGAVLRVPGERAAAPPPRRSRRSRTEAATDGAPRRGRRDGASPAPVNRTPLIVGALVVVAAAVAVVLVNAGGSGEDGAESRGGRDAAEAGTTDGTPGDTAATPPPPPPADPQWAAATTPSQRRALAKERADAAKHSEESARALHAALVEKGEPTLARLAAEARLEADPESAWANETLGRVSMAAALAPFAEHADLLDENPVDAWTASRDLLEHPWIDASQRASVEERLDLVRSHLDNLTDPWFVEMLQVVDSVRTSPEFKPFLPIEYAAVKPYVVLVQCQTDPDGYSTQNILNNHANLFRCLTGEFLGKMKEAGLPDVTIAEMGNPVLKAFVFLNRNSMERWHWNQGAAHDALKGIGAYYAWGSHQFMIMNNQPPEGTQDPHTCTAFHEGTHQLVHYYRRHYLTLKDREKNPEAPQVSLLDARLHGESHFFGEGFAEFVGTADRISSITGEWKLFGLNRQRMAEWGSPKVRRTPSWTIGEILEMQDSRQLNLLSEKKWEGYGTTMQSLYYAQAWSLHHFLYFGEDGAWRKRYLEWIHEEMMCHSGYEVFMECMGAGKGDEERSAFLKDLEKRWHAYAHACMFKGR